MRNSKTNGFTLIELLIVIAIVGILAAVLIPNLLNARERAFDTAAQTCLKEISTQFEVVASNAPFTYDATTFTYTAGTTTSDPTTTFGGLLNGCENVYVDAGVSSNGDGFYAVAQHVNGTTVYEVRNGQGVVPVGEGMGYQGDGTDATGVAVPTA